MIRLKNDIRGVYPWNETNKRLLDNKPTCKKAMTKLEKAEGVNVTISEEGKAKLADGTARENAEYYELKYLTPKETDELYNEHYGRMLEISATILNDISKERDYDTDDVMRATAEALEVYYNELMEKHKDGNRSVEYGLTGKWEISLEDDLEVFEEAYASCVDGIRIFMQIQDENEYCPLSDISWLLERKGIEATKKSKPDERHIMQMKKYISEMEDVMKRTKETLFFEYANSGYQKGMATGILGRMMKVWRAQNKELEEELMGEKAKTQHKSLS